MPVKDDRRGQVNHTDPCFTTTTTILVITPLHYQNTRHISAVHVIDLYDRMIVQEPLK